MKHKKNLIPVFALLLILLLVIGYFAGKPLLTKILQKADASESASPASEELIQGNVTLPNYVTPCFLTVSDYNRPGTALTSINNIVIHYVANPGTSAMNNRNYFENLADPASNPSGAKASAHFIIGLDGEIIQCIPVTEIAWANYPRNDDTISIECCHPDADGKFNDATYRSLVKLTAFLCRTYGLTENDVIRHHDVSGKACPLYYVEHEDAWAQLKADIGNELN